MNPRHRDFQSLALPTELPAHENADMLGWLENFVELFIEQAGIIKQLWGMSKTLNTPRPLSTSEVESGIVC